MRRFITRSCSWLAVSIALVSSAAMHSSPALGMELKPSEIRGKTQELPVSVLQNRYFLKTGRPEIGLAAGTFLNESYTDTSTLGVRGSLFFTEWLGVEVQYIKTDVKDSDDRKALNEIRYRKLDSETIVTPDPEVNNIYNISDINAIFAPFYGKLNFMDQLIVYSDVYFTAGTSKVDTEQGSKVALTIGAGQRFYWKKSVSFRVDYRDRIFKEQRVGKETQKNSHCVDIGMSYFFM